MEWINRIKCPPSLVYPAQGHGGLEGPQGRVYPGTIHCRTHKHRHTSTDTHYWNSEWVRESKRNLVSSLFITVEVWLSLFAAHIFFIYTVYIATCSAPAPLQLKTPNNKQLQLYEEKLINKIHIIQLFKVCVMGLLLYLFSSFFSSTFYFSSLPERGKTEWVNFPAFSHRTKASPGLHY